MNEATDEFYTDEQLCKRWKCSHMKLWRLRQQGKLKPPVKIGGGGRNLTPGSEVKSLEGGMLRPQDALTVARAIIHEVDALGIEDQPAATAKDRTAAERQRRRRSKQRDSERDSDRDTVTVTPGELPLRLIAAE